MNDPFYEWVFWGSVGIAGLFVIIGIGLLVSHCVCKKGGQNGL